MKDNNQTGVIQEQGYLFEDQNTGFRPLSEGEEDPFNHKSLNGQTCPSNADCDEDDGKR